LTFGSIRDCRVSFEPLDVVLSTHVPRHGLEAVDEHFIRPVELKPLGGILGERAENDERAQLAVDVAVFELFADRAGGFLWVSADITGRGSGAG
jgi:hypothetical protein